MNKHAWAENSPWEQHHMYKMLVTPPAAGKQL